MTETKQTHSHENATVRAIMYAFVANLCIALIKSWAAVYTGSGSMLAEAIHSFADSGNQVLLFIGLKQSQKPADEQHPLGYGKVSYFYSFVVALMLFSLGGLFSIYEGIHKLQQPEPLNQIWVAMAVLVLAVCLEATAMFGVLREIGRLRGPKPIGLWLKTTRNAELVVVLGEDFAALTGLTLALIFVGLAAVTGNPVYDAIGSICIGVVLIIVSVFVALRIRDLLIGKSAEPELRQEIDELIKADSAVIQVFNIITFQMGPKVLLAAKVKLRPDMTINEAVIHLNDLEKKLKASRPEIGWIFIEPDITD